MKERSLVRQFIAPQVDRLAMNEVRQPAHASRRPCGLSDIECLKIGLLKRSAQTLAEEGDVPA
jgi:hypothetical protein